MKTILETNAKLSKLRAVDYYYDQSIKDRNFPHELQFGFIANEVQEILPHLVRQDSNSYRYLR